VRPPRLLPAAPRDFPTGKTHLLRLRASLLGYIPSEEKPMLKASRLHRTLLAALATLALTFPMAHAQDAQTPGQWRSYGGTEASMKYSPLDQIDASNVADLEIVWRWSSPENEIIERERAVQAFSFELTPLMIGYPADRALNRGPLGDALHRIARSLGLADPDWMFQNGILYAATSISQVAAIDAVSGETLWVYDPESWRAGRPTNLGFIHRGVAYWSDGDDERIFIGTGDSRLIAIDAKTGLPIESWGDSGEIDLTKGLRRPVNPRHYAVSSPPIVCRGVVVVGSSIFDLPSTMEGAPGDVRGFDARTGELRWTFHSVPQEGEFGNETWENDSWKYTGNTNVWTLMSADEELGLVYLPFGTPTNDWYGGHRLGDNLFAESLVAVNAETGERVWHYQTVHHGVWDYDLPAAPNLLDIVVDGRPIKAVAQITKQGFTFVFDRATGEPVWPIEERPVPPSDVPGERLSPTQPHPTWPLPFETQGVSEDDLIDLTPELHAEAKELLKQYHYGPLFTPPTTKGTINLPGWGGGANWGGAAFDPETGFLYIPSIKHAIRVELGQPNPARSNMAYMRQGGYNVEGPQGLPLFKPPWSTVTAIDMNSGEHVWRVPLGDGPRDHPALKDLDLPRLGTISRGYPLATKTLLFVAQEAQASRTGGHGPEGGAAAHPGLNVFDKATGELLHRIELGLSPGGAPITYMAGGRQYIVCAVGGGKNIPSELVALALPE
jgi:quinoprotein glucose dehydrogenase